MSSFDKMRVNVLYIQSLHVNVFYSGETGMPQVGEMVRVPKLRKDAKVVQVLAGKKIVVVQSGSIQLRLSFSDIERVNRRQ